MLKTGIYSFTIVLVCTVFLISFSVAGSYAYETINPPEQQFAQGTQISAISIGELTNEVAKQKIEQEIANWKESKKVTFHYLDQEVTLLAGELFSFDSDASLQLAKTEKVVPLVVTVNDNQITELLSQLSKRNLGRLLKQDVLHEDLKKYACNLPNEEFHVNVHDYFLDEFRQKEVIISEHYINNLTVTNELQQFVRNLNGFEIVPKTELSFRSILKELNLSSSNGEEMNIVATALYKTLLATNFEILQRETSVSLPEYSELGFEAFVSGKESDLRFYNPNILSYTLIVNLDGNVLHTALKGYQLENIYKIKLAETETFEPKRVLQYSAEVPIGQRVISQEGKKGYATAVYREVYDRLNRKLDQSLISKDFYRPTHIIEVRSLIAAEPAYSPEQEGLTNPSNEAEEDQHSTMNENEKISGQSLDQQNDEENKQIDINDEIEPIKGY